MNKKLVGVIALALGICFALSPVQAESLEDYLSAPVPPQKAGTPVPVPGSFRGQLRSVNYAVLSAGIAAQIERFGVSTGSRIDKGQTIAEFDCAIARVDHRIGISRHDAAAENLEVNERLNTLKNVSELDLNTSRAELAIAEAEVDRSSTILEECVLLAPFSGTVTEKFVQAYEFVNLGDPLIELVDTRNLEVEMVLPSMHLASYREGTLFSLRIDETGQVVKARVDRVVDAIDPVSQTLRVIGKLTEPTSGLMPGMSGVVTFVAIE